MSRVRNTWVGKDKEYMEEGKMPFNCDVCGEEVSYSEPVFKIRNGAEIVICNKCIRKANKKK